MATFDRDGANTRLVVGTDNTGTLLDGQVRVMQWDTATTAWVRFTGNVIADAPTAYATEFDYDAAATPNLVYLGLAVPGTATSAAAWQIRKFTTSGSNPTSMLWAGGSGTFTNIWDNRASLTYS